MRMRNKKEGDTDGTKENLMFLKNTECRKFWIRSFLAVNMHGAVVISFWLDLDWPAPYICYHLLGTSCSIVYVSACMYACFSSFFLYRVLSINAPQYVYVVAQNISNAY